jgi:peroxiredoxin (alkyl hydroperoxide reductase subunit C)
MADGTIEESFCFDDFSSGRYVVIFFYPLDFTFVCPSEILAFANRYEAISAMNADVLGVSIDSHHTHRAWRETPLTDGGIGAVPFALAADLTREISRAYGVLSEAGDSYYPEGVAMRATFILDANGVVRHQVINDEPLGRNIDEVLRVLGALQFFEQHGQVCPAGWTAGQKGMSNTPGGVAEYLSEHGATL